MANKVNEKRWPLRLLLVALGSCAAVLGILGLKNGVWWIPGINYQLGRVGITPTITLVFLGLIFVLIGLIPWGKRIVGSNRKERR